jgi:hypothetical protein
MGVSSSSSHNFLSRCRCGSVCSESLLTDGFAFRMFISTARRLRVMSSSDLNPSSVSHTCRAESYLC